jgi:hypothetical protein
MNVRTDNSDTGLFYETLIQSYVNAPHFVERTWLAEQIEEKLAKPGCRFLLLTAEPGAGKTAFAAWLAHEHADWLRYFIRRDSQTPLSSGDARSCLFAVSHQLAARRPRLFRSEQLEVVVEQRVRELQAEGKVVGIQVEDLRVSPFYRTVLKVEQDVPIVAGELAGISAKHMTVEKRILEIGNLQHLALLDPAAALLAEDARARIVVLIDALDELRYHPGQDNILQWLASCPELPSNVRVVLTSRPDDEMLSRFRRSQERWLREAAIDPRSERVQGDLRRYVTGFSAQDSVKDALVGQDVDASDFAARFVAKAEGNFQYVAALFRGIEQAIAGGEQEQLHQLLSGADLPAGLEQLYAFFLTLIRDSVADQKIEIEGEDSLDVTYLPAWEGLYQPVLGVLAVAREPLADGQIASLGSIQAEDRWLQGALGRLGQFLEQEGKRYRLYHSSFPEFLTSPETREEYPESYLNPDEWHRKIARFYRSQGASWEEINWGEIGDYGLSHLPAHLYALRHTKAGRGALYGLICKSFMDEKFTRTYSQRAFAQDVDLVVQAAGAEDPVNWVEFVRGCLLYATLGSMATNAPPEALGVLALMGDTHQVARARGYAALIQDRDKQADAYRRIGEALSRRGEPDKAREVLMQALAAAEVIRDGRRQHRRRGRRWWPQKRLDTRS